MVKVENGIATSEPIPAFLVGLAADSLADLRWTDPALGVSDCAWWPEVDESAPLSSGKKYSGETLTADPARKVVVVTRKQVNLTAAEKAEKSAQAFAEWAGKIAARRYQAEIAGVTVGGMRIETDDRAKVLIDGAALAAVIDPEYSLRWKTADGFVTLSAAQVIGIAKVGRDYVQACFDREADLLQAVGGGTITEEALEQGWP